MIRSVEPGDAELLLRFIAEHDEAAFEAIMARHGRMVLAVCRRILKNTHDADDAFQATFLLLSQKARSVRKRDSLASWLQGVATRIAVRAKARSTERRLREERAMATAGIQDDLWQRIRPALDEELLELPEKYRSPLVLCYLEGETNESAARKLGWPAGTIAKVLARGRELLRGRFLRRGVAVTSSVLAAVLVKQAVGQAVPSTLAVTTAKLATLMATGVSGAVSPPVFALVKGGLKTMLIAKVKAVAAAAVVATLLSAGAGAVAYRAIAEPEALLEQSAKPSDSSTINYEVSQPGQISLAVFDAAGRHLRTLVNEQKMKPGAYSVTWDGLSGNGESMPAGTYEWRLLQTPGFKREYLITLGTNPGWAPYGRWPGNHGGWENAPGGVTTMMIDQDGALYLGSAGAEVCPHMVKQSLDGKKNYWNDFGTNGLPGDGLERMIRINDILYCLLSDGKIYVMSAETSGLLWGHPKYDKFPRTNPDQHLPFANLLDPKPKRVDTNGSEPLHAIDMALRRNQFVMSYQACDLVRVYTLNTDRPGLDLAKEIEVKQPRGLTISPEGRVFVVSGSKIVEVDVDKGEVKPLIADARMQHPLRLAYEPLSKDLLVATFGPNENHVRRYHVADGKLVAVYGRPEGRTYGIFNPLDFDRLMDIIADGKGGFLTAEEYPRRVARFKGRENLELIDQWFGGVQWGAVPALDPADPSIAYTAPDGHHLGRVKIDYAAKKWTLTHLYAELTVPLFPGFSAATYWNVRHVGKETYLYSSGQNGSDGIAVARIDEAKNQVVPVARAGSLHPSVDVTNPPKWWTEAMKRAGYELGDPKHPDYPKCLEHHCYSWSDSNGNGAVDPEEIHLASCGNGLWASYAYVDEAWNLIRGIHGGYPLHGTVPGIGSSAWVEMANEGKAGGVPLWNWDHAKPSKGQWDAKDQSLRGYAARGLFRDAQGNVYAACAGSIEGDNPPTYWPHNLKTFSRLLKWNAAGAVEWTVGLHADTLPKSPPGTPWYAIDWADPHGKFGDIRGILGEVKDCIVVLDATAPASVWTKDGMYAGDFLDGRADDGLPFQAYNGGVGADSYWGNVVQSPKGEVYWTPMDQNNNAVYKIHGFDGWKRTSGKIVLKAASTAASWKGTGLRGEYFANQDLSGNPALTRVDPQIWFGPVWGDHIEQVAKFALSSGKDGVDTARCSVRWTGFFEAPLSEDVEFNAVATIASDQGKGSKVRLWVNGELAVDFWNGVTPTPAVDGFIRSRPNPTKPFRLKAGQRVPIKLEFVAAGGPACNVHLYWKSASFEMRHVPKALLYPDDRRD